MKSEIETSPAFEQVMQNNAFVSQAIQRGLSKEAIIVTLVREIEFLQSRVLELDSIAPKKIKKSDGSIWVWHCPDELIPLKQ